MSRRALILDLKDDPELIAAYEAHHRPGAVPEAVLTSIRESGIQEMEIYRSGNRLVMVIESSDNFHPGAKAAADAADPAVIAWEELMDRYQQRLPWAAAGAKWVEAGRIFALSEHSKTGGGVPSHDNT